MKKILVTLLALAALFTFAACNAPEERTTVPCSTLEAAWLTEAGIDPDKFYGYSELDDAAFARLRTAAAKTKINISRADGILTTVTEEGYAVFLGAYAPQNEFYLLLPPACEYGLLSYSAYGTDENDCPVYRFVHTHVTQTEATAYFSALETFGFAEDAVTASNAALFSATHATNKNLSVFVAHGEMGLAVEFVLEKTTT